MRVAIRGGAMGDVLLGIPAWRALRDDAPLASFVACAPAAMASLVRVSLEMPYGPAPLGEMASRRPPVVVVTPDDPAIASLHAVGAPSASAAIPAWDAIDVAVAWTRSHCEIVARLRAAGVARPIGADPFPPAGARIHAADWLAATLGEVGVAVAPDWDAVPWLRVPSDADVTGVLEGDDRPEAILHPGSGSRRKWWRADRWRAVVESLLKDEWRVTVLEGAPDGEIVAAVLQGDGVPAAWAGRVTLVRGEAVASVAARLAGASLVLSNDSGIAHLAAGLGAPVVAVFGPTDPAVWRPRGPRVAVLGGTPGSVWPHAGSAPPADVSWPTVGAMVEAIRSVVPDVRG